MVTMTMTRTINVERKGKILVITRTTGTHGDGGDDNDDDDYKR